MNETARFIVTVEFEHTDSVAVAVEAETKEQASDAAFDFFLADPYSDRPEATHTQTVAEFEADFGPYTDAMFTLIQA